MLKPVSRCVLLAIVLAPMSSAGQKSGVEQVEWLSGCWASDDGKERIEEVWMKPAGQSMIGMSRTVAGGKTVSAEHAQIREHNGRVAYIVSISMGAKPVVFTLAKASENEAVFENPTHDFPQRIIYRRESAEALFARIEGPEKGVNKAIDFRYKRAKCD
jgi:hypothetical protein